MIFYSIKLYNKVYKNNKIETNLENFIETFINFKKKESDTIQNNNKKIKNKVLKRLEIDNKLLFCNISQTHAAHKTARYLRPF